MPKWQNSGAVALPLSCVGAQLGFRCLMLTLPVGGTNEGTAFRYPLFFFSSIRVEAREQGSSSSYLCLLVLFHKIFLRSWGPYIKSPSHEVVFPFLCLGHGAWVYPPVAVSRRTGAQRAEASHAEDQTAEVLPILRTGGEFSPVFTGVPSFVFLPRPPLPASVFRLSRIG